MKNKSKQLRIREVQDVLDVIGGRWKGAILACLCDGEKRFGELKIELDGVTPRVLTNDLRYLEQSKLIERVRHPDNAVAVIYRLTEHGHSLEPVIQTIAKWGVKHRAIALS
jgi:DNA-binding HxlR family transcriptional regulator